MSEEVGTGLKIISRHRPNDVLRNGEIPLCYVDSRSSKIRICADGWGKTARLKGFDSLARYFSLRRGIRDISRAISHESIHQVLFRLEGRNVSFNLDKVSGAGEII
jgi:hypothetical protein